MTILPSCVIQIDPLPIPILRPSAPASIKFLACAAVTTENGQKCNKCNQEENSYFAFFQW